MSLIGNVSRDNADDGIQMSTTTTFRENHTGTHISGIDMGSNECTSSGCP